MQTSVPVFRESPHSCPYLPEEQCSNLRFVLNHADAGFLDLLLEKGFRHFGENFFRPDCPACRSCEGIRIPIPEFTFSRSQKRVLNKNQDLILNVGPVVIDQERIDLLNAFQVMRTAQKGWELIQYNANQYDSSFTWIEHLSHEMTLRSPEGRLLALGLIDLGEKAASATYHFYDPLEAHRSLGKVLILNEIQWLAQRNYRYLYLGLANQRCDSLRYKYDYEPHEIQYDEGWRRPHKISADQTFSA